MIDKIFEKENKYYRFYILLPMLLWLELLVLTILNSGRFSMAGVLFVFTVVCSMTSLGLFAAYSMASGTFEKQYAVLTEEQRKSIEEKGIAKAWKVYLSQDFLIQYGMFTKRIIDLADIESVRRSSGIRKMRRYSEEYDEMILVLCTGKYIAVDTSDNVWKAINLLLKKETVKQSDCASLDSESVKPIEGITALAVLASIVLFMGGYYHVLQLCNQAATPVGRELFAYGYEGIFWLGGVILTGVCILVTFIWRAMEKRKRKFDTKMFTIWVAIILLMLMYVSVEYDNKFTEDTQAARVEYRQYREER